MKIERFDMTEEEFRKKLEHLQKDRRLSDEQFVHSASLVAKEYLESKPDGTLEDIPKEIGDLIGKIQAAKEIEDRKHG